MKGLRQEYWSRVTQGEKSALRGQWENVISGNGDSCSFSHGSNRGQKAQWSSPAPKAETQSPFWKERPDFLVQKSSSKENVRNRHVIFGILPVCLNYMSESGCTSGDYCQFRHTEAGGQPCKKSKESGGIQILKKKNPSCKFWHPPVCLNYRSEKGRVHGDKCHFRHVEAEGKPSNKSNKGGATGSVALLKESVQLGCISRFKSEKVFST